MIEKEIVPPPESKKFEHAWPPLFALLEFQFGAGVGFLQVTAGRWLSNDGVSIAEVGTLAAVAGSAHFWKLFWVPLLDLGPWRKTWYLVCTFATGVLALVSCTMKDPAHHMAAYTVLMTAIQVTCSTAHAALNGLMATTTRVEDKGRTAGWQMAGNVGSTSLLGALPITIAGLWSREAAGVVLALIVFASAAGILWVPAQKAVARAAGPVLDAVREQVKAVALDLFRTAISRDGLVLLILCLLPVSCGALTNLFTAVANEFHASDSLVAWVNGPGMGITGSVGSLAGGYVAERLNKKINYALWGGATGLCALGLAFVPFNETTYTWGVLAYSLANGCAFAAFAAMVLEMVTESAAVTTKYTLFVASSNLAINYTTQLDGMASNWPRFMGGGARGTILFDALITLGGIGVVVLLFLTVLRKKPAPVTAGSG